MRLIVPSLTAIALAITGCAQQPLLSAGTPLNGPATVAAPQVAGWQSGTGEAAPAVMPVPAEGGDQRRSRAGRVLAAIALSRVTGRSIDPGRLVTP
ncbi:MAG: hypothetical protein R3D27_03830 [Hyphomicrobiaceae bacterium]